MGGYRSGTAVCPSYPGSESSARLGALTAPEPGRDDNFELNRDAPPAAADPPSGNAPTRGTHRRSQRWPRMLHSNSGWGWGASSLHRDTVNASRGTIRIHHALAHHVHVISVLTSSCHQNVVRATWGTLGEGLTTPLCTNQDWHCQCDCGDPARLTGGRRGSVQVSW